MHIYCSTGGLPTCSDMGAGDTRLDIVVTLISGPFRYTKALTPSFVPSSTVIAVWDVKVCVFNLNSFCWNLCVWWLSAANVQRTHTNITFLHTLTRSRPQ